MSSSLADSIQFCRRLARRTGKNFYWSFLTLPRDMRRDMCVLYAFMRLTDDIGDRSDAPPESRRGCLELWRGELTGALGEDAASPMNPVAPSIRSDDLELVKVDAVQALPAVVDLVHRRKIPPQLLYHVIDGVASDQTRRRFQTFAELESYCYHVAGAVGLCCIHIWGFDGSEAECPAVDCGTAFQLTNILRDLRDDARQDRVYLPQEELQRFGVSEDELCTGRVTDNLRRLIGFQTERARDYYRRGAGLLPHLSPEGRRVQSAMLRIYGGLLTKLEQSRGDVFSSRIELSKWRKLAIVFQSFLSTSS